MSTNNELKVRPRCLEINRTLTHTTRLLLRSNEMVTLNTNTRVKDPPISTSVKGDRCHCYRPDFKADPAETIYIKIILSWRADSVMTEHIKFANCTYKQTNNVNHTSQDTRRTAGIMTVQKSIQRNPFSHFPFILTPYKQAVIVSTACFAHSVLWILYDSKFQQRLFP
jgi:hypothetical protein